MLKIGCHLSVANGYANMGETALKIGANTFQYFTRNPQGSQVKKVDEKDVTKLKKIMEVHQFAPILGHAPYTQNPSSANPELRNLAKRMMSEDIHTMETYLPGNLYNFHPGSHGGQGVEVGIRQIQQMLNDVLQKNQTTTVLLEMMSGKKNEIGSRFEELAEILAGIELSEKMGICMDTCHVFCAGYDIINKLDDVFQKFDKTIGLSKLKAIHLNDSMMPFKSHKDRHAKIGEGSLGLKGIVRFMQHPVAEELPFYLETPNDVFGYAQEISLLKEEYARRF